MSECSALLTACLAQRTPYSLSERSALLTACLSAARTQSVGKLAFKKDAVRWQAGFQEGRSSLTSCLTRRTQYFLWSCLTDAVRRRVASSRTVRGTVTSKTYFKARCRSE